MMPYMRGRMSGIGFIFQPTFQDELERLQKMQALKKMAEDRQDRQSKQRLLEVICEAYQETRNPLFLQRGIELTKMTAEELSQYASDLGLTTLADAYHSYSQKKEIV